MKQIPPRLCLPLSVPGTHSFNGALESDLNDQGWSQQLGNWMAPGLAWVSKVV